MQRLIPMIDNSGVRYSIPEDRVDEFRADMGENASEGRRYRGKDGTHYTIPQDQDEAFRADMPDAVPVRTMQMSDGTKRDFTMSEMSKFLRSKEYRESKDYAESQDVMRNGKYGKRNDGTWKGSGYLGELPIKGGGVATEYSVGVNIDGKETEIPTLVPTLTKDEVSLMTDDIIPNGKEIPQSILNKAVEFARSRMANGESVWANSGAPKAPEMGSPFLAGFKGALSGALSGAYAGGKSALSKVVSAVPELVAGATEAVGNAANLGGNAPNAVGNWFRDSGRGVKKWLDDNVKSSVADNLGYEDWSTKMSEIAGDAAGMAVKFAPAAAAGPAFMESVFATDGINAYTSSFEAAKANGASDFDANLAGAASGLIAYYGGKLLMKGNAATSEIKSVLGKALGGIGWDAAVMAAQQAGEKGVQNAIEGNPITQDMLGAGLEGAATGALFRIFNEGSRVRNVVRETKQMREMRRENLLTAAENTNGGAFLDSLMGGEEMNSAVRARRNGEDVSRKMGKELDLPDNMSVKERNAVVDAVIRARDAQAERVRTRMDDVQAQSLADAIGGTVGDMNDPNFEKVWIKAVGQIKDATELDDPAKRAEIVWNAVKEVFGAEADGNDGVKREAVFDERSLREKNKQNLKERNVSAMERDAAEQRAGMKAAEQEDTQAKIDAKINAKIADQKAQKEEFAVEMHEKAQAEYDERMAAYEEARAKRAAEMKKTGKAVTELPPKPDYDALLAEQKSRMEAADKAAADAAHEERGKGLAVAFADWREESVKAQKQGKKSPEPTAEVEDVRAKAEADSVVQRLNAKWQKAKTPAERNAIKVQLIDRLKQLGIGAIERGTSAAEKPAEPAKPQPADNAPSRAPRETEPTISSEGAEGKGARNSASVVTVGSMTERMTAKGRIVDSVVKVNDDGSVIIREQTFRKGNDKPYRETDRTYSADEAAQIIGNKTPTTTKTIRVPDGKGKMVEKPKGGNDYDSLVESYKSNEDRLTEAVNSGNEVARLEALIEQAKTELKLRKAEVGMTKTFDRTANMSLTNNALKNRISDLMEALAIERGQTEKISDGRGRMVEKPAQTPETKTKSVAPAPAPKATAPVVEKAMGEETKPKMTNAEAEAEFRKFIYGEEDTRAEEVVTQLGPEKAQSILASATKDFKMSDAAKDRSDKLQAYISTMGGKETPLGNPGGGNARQKYDTALKKRFDAEREAAMKPLNDAIRAKADAVLADMKDGETKNGIKKEIDELLAKDSLKKSEINRLKLLLDRAPSSGNKIEVPLGKAGSLKVADNIGALLTARDNLRGLGRDAARKYYEVAEADRLAALRSDAKVRSWAQKNGYSVVDGEVSPRAVTEYLRSQTKKAVVATKRLFKDAEVEVKDRDWNAEIDGENGAIRDSEGRIVGTFDPATKKVTLYRGADERTVYHELIGHGVEDWARRNNTALHGKLTELARTAPRELVEDVRSRYPDADEATLTKEIIARIAEGKGLENIKLKDAPKAWYAKAYVAVKDALVGFMEKIGLNRIDLSKTDDMTPSEAMDYLMREIGKGKTLGEIGTEDAQGKMTSAEKWANKYYDRHTSLGKVSKEAADAKALQPGREAEFEIMKFNPKKEEFKKLLKDGNVTGNEVDEYMRAVAAKERNAADGRESSGMSDERIDATLRFYENHPRINAIKRAADFMWRLQDEGMRERIRSGLVSEAEYAEWKAREEHHVPFRSAIDENGDHIAWNDPRGVAGHEFVQHEGRYSESGSPTAWMFEEYANAHLRAIENDTRKVLADAVSRDASLGSIETNPNLRESRLNGDGGDRNVVSYKEVGENGRAVVKHIVLKGERGAAAASSYTNRDLMNKSPLLKKTQAFMRFWSSTATEWSPTFALRNTFADNVDLAAVVLAEKGAKEGGAWIKDYAKNRVAVAKEVWRFAHKGKVDANSTLGRYVREGGMIGGFQREGYGDLVKQFSAEDIAKDFSNGGNRAKAVAKKVFGLVGAVNTYAELMTRVSAFKTNLDNGMSAKDAALWSRRISVDFNRKGNVTPVTNTLYMFSNSTIGATIRQLEAVKTAWKTPEGRRALLGLAAFGVAEALLEHAMNVDSDEEREKKGEATGKDVNEFTRKTSLYVRVGGRVFRAPTHEDPLMKIVYAANAATRVALGTMSKEDFAKEVGLGIVEDVPRFFGQGGKNVDAGFNTWVPTALQPLVQGIENKDYAGRPIYRPKYNESLPDSSNGRKSTQAQYKWAAETVNELTGGNKGRKGSVDIAPETVKLISESLGKNVGKDIGNAIDVGWNLLTGNFGELDSRRAPFVRDVVRKTEGNDNRYFEAVRRFNADKLDLQTRDKARNWKDGERRAYYEAHPHLRKNGGTSTRVERLINGHTDGDTYVPGINDLRRMEGGERRVKTAAGWKWRAYDWPAEKVEEFKRKRLEKQAKVLAIMGD